MRKEGVLLPVIVQEYESRQILMQAYVNAEAVMRSLETRLATFYKTSENRLWTKGETSRDYLKIRDILVDCDQDALVYVVDMVGDGACHTKLKSGKSRKSCFYRKISGQDSLELIENGETLLNQDNLNILEEAQK